MKSIEVVAKLLVLTSTRLLVLSEAEVLGRVVVVLNLSAFPFVGSPVVPHTYFSQTPKVIYSNKDTTAILGILPYIQAGQSRVVVQFRASK